MAFALPNFDKLFEPFNLGNVDSLFKPWDFSKIKEKLTPSQAAQGAVSVRLRDQIRDTGGKLASALGSTVSTTAGLALKPVEIAGTVLAAPFWGAKKVAAWTRSRIAQTIGGMGGAAVLVAAAPAREPEAEMSKPDVTSTPPKTEPKKEEPKKEEPKKEGKKEDEPKKEAKKEGEPKKEH